MRSAAVAAIAAMTLAACSSANPSPSSKGSTAQATTTPSGSSDGAASQPAGTGDYAKLMDTARSMVPATFQGPTTPTKAPTGIKIAAITCYSILEGCVIPANGITEAAKAIGWEARTFDGGGTPTSQNKQILNAVAWGANVIALIAITPSAVQTGLIAAKNSGAIIISGSSGLSSPNATIQPPSGEVWPAFDVSPDYKKLGEYLGDWVVADSNGKANIAVYGDKEFDSINAQETGIVPTLKACGTCTSSPVMYFTSTQIASTLGSEVVSYLRTHPDTDYIYAGYDPPAVAMVQAIQNAGMASKVKLVSVLGNAQNLQFVKNGQVQVADAAYDNTYMGYAMVDQSIRMLNHQPLIEPLGEGLPFQVLDKSNLPSDLSSWTAPYDYKSAYLKLWKG